MGFLCICIITQYFVKLITMKESNSFLQRSYLTKVRVSLDYCEIFCIDYFNMQTLVLSTLFPKRVARYERALIDIQRRKLYLLNRTLLHKINLKCDGVEIFNDGSFSRSSQNSLTAIYSPWLFCDVILGKWWMRKVIFKSPK